MLSSMVRRFETEKREYTFQAETIEEYIQWKKNLRTRLFEISGINRCERCEGREELIRVEEVEGFKAEYHLLETEPDVFMPFYLIRPEVQKKDMPVLVIPHGHGGGKKEILGYQGDFIRGALEDGYLVACPDERGSGDRREFTQQGDSEEMRRGNSHRELLHLAISFGLSVIGMAVWDLMRLTDWLQALPETGDDLVCAGMSGGGQQTLWFSALDDRVSAAITSGYFYGVKEALVEMPQNCSCNYVPHFFETCDMGELGALIAPRPFFVESCDDDQYSGKSRVANVIPQLNTVRRAYRLFNAEDRITHSVQPGDHHWVGEGMREFMRQAKS